MRFYGLIHGVDLNNKLISIKRFNKLYFFYFQNSLMHLKDIFIKVYLLIFPMMKIN